MQDVYSPKPVTVFVGMERSCRPRVGSSPKARKSLLDLKSATSIGPPGNDQMQFFCKWMQRNSYGRIFTYNLTPPRQAQEDSKTSCTNQSQVLIKCNRALFNLSFTCPEQAQLGMEGLRNYCRLYLYLPALLESSSGSFPASIVESHFTKSRSCSLGINFAPPIVDQDLLSEPARQVLTDMKNKTVCFGEYLQSDN